MGLIAIFLLLGGLLCSGQSPKAYPRFGKAPELWTADSLSRYISEFSLAGDYPSFREPKWVTASERVPVVGTFTLGDIFYGRVKTFPQFLGTVQKETDLSLNRFDFKQPGQGLSLDLAGTPARWALWLDSETAVALAEAQFRLDPSPGRLEILIDILARTGSTARLEELSRGERAIAMVKDQGFIKEIDSSLLYRDSSDLAGSWHDYYLAILKGDVQKAKKSADTFRLAARKISNPAQNSEALQAADRMLGRVEAMRSGVKTDGDEWARLVARAKSELKSSKMSISELYGSMSEEVLVGEINRLARELGNGSARVTDSVLFLVEQTSFTAEKLNPAIWRETVVRMSDSRNGNTLRMLPAALGWQHAAMKDPKRGEEVVEAAQWFLKGIRSENMTSSTAVWKVANLVYGRAVEVTSSDLQPVSKLEPSLVGEWWALCERTGHRDSLQIDYGKAIQHSRNPETQQKARAALLKHCLNNSGDRETALALLKDAYEKQKDPVLRLWAVQSMLEWGKSWRDESLWALGKSWAEESVRTIRKSDPHWTAIEVLAKSEKPDFGVKTAAQKENVSPENPAGAGVAGAPVDKNNPTPISPKPLNEIVEKTPTVAPPVSDSPLVSALSKPESSKQVKGAEITPYELAVKLKDISGFGTYKTDLPGGVVKAKERSIVSGAPDIEHLYFYTSERSLGKLLGAVGQSDFLSNKNLSNPLFQAVATAMTVDTATAVALAEVRVRLATSKDVLPALQQLAAVTRNGDLEKYRNLLSLGDQYMPGLNSQPTAELEVLWRYKEGQSVEDLFYNHQAALARNNAEKARQFLDILMGKLMEDPTQELNQPEKRKELQDRMNRLERWVGLGLSDGEKEEISTYFDRLKKKESGDKRSIAELMKDLSEEEVVGLIRQVANEEGRQSENVADLVLGLIEQKQGAEVALPVDILMWSAIQVRLQYGEARSLPVFKLCQKVGSQLETSEPGQQIELSKQFSIESAIYIAEGVEQMKPSKEIQSLAIINLESAISQTSNLPSGSRAKGYLHMAYEKLWAMRSLSGNGKKNVEEWKNLATAKEKIPDRLRAASTVYWLRSTFLRKKTEDAKNTALIELVAAREKMKDASAIERLNAELARIGK